MTVFITLLFYVKVTGHKTVLIKWWLICIL
ncbi:MAG: hypothetical protein ACJAU1_001005 [Psychromonas sp.]